MAHLYYNEGLDSQAFHEGATLSITGDEARHAIRVSRLRQHERVFIGNGAGDIGEGTVNGLTNDRFTVEIESVKHEEAPNPRFWLVQALAKGDRAERALEQATELGVHGVMPWQADRSVSRWDGKEHKALARWQRIVREASKQSIRSRIPVVSSVRGTADLVGLVGEASLVLVLHPRASQRLTDLVPPDPQVDDVYVCVGPEGGISDTELNLLSKANARTVTLGPHILRTSSAGPAALAACHVRSGNW